MPSRGSGNWSTGWPRCSTEHAELIRQRQPKVRGTTCGYHLADVLGDGYVDVAKLLVGSEGTLALITEALLGTEPLPPHRGVTLLLFDSLEKAARTVLDVLAEQPTACESDGPAAPQPCPRSRAPFRAD